MSTPRTTRRGRLFGLGAVLSKEATDAARDRRSLIASLSVAVLSPLMIFLLLTTIARDTAEERDLRVAVVNAQAAPTLLEWLEERDVELVDQASEDAALAALGADLPSALVLPEDYARRYEERRPAEIAIYADTKRERAAFEARRLEDLIEAYAATVATARLVAEGVRPDIAAPLTVQRYDLATAGGFSVQMSGLLTYIFLIAGFVSGAFMAADSVAGERERHSLQPLLAQPLTPLTLVIGKWLVAGSVAALVSMATILFGGWLLSIAPLAELGLRFYTSPGILLLAAVSTVPLAGAAAALQLYLASMAKTYREASTYAQYTMFLPIVVVGATQFAGVEYGPVADYLPISGHDHVLREVFLEGHVPGAALLVTTMTTLALVAVLVWLAARRLGDEAALGA